MGKHMEWPRATAIGLACPLPPTFLVPGFPIAVDGRDTALQAGVYASLPRGTTHAFTVTARIDTPEELVAFRHGGILPYVVRQLVSRS